MGGKLPFSIKTARFIQFCLFVQPTEQIYSDKSLSFSFLNDVYFINHGRFASLNIPRRPLEERTAVSLPDSDDIVLGPLYQKNISISL